MAKVPARDGASALGLGVRIALTVALVYGLHGGTNVVRETYLAVAIAERFTIRVDPYVGLHPDLFEIPGRGAFINNNPGASMLAAVPYAAVRPALTWLYRMRPSLVAPKPPAVYDDPRPNRTRFMNEARARGMDVRLVVAGVVMQALCNVPLAVVATLAIFGFLRRRLLDDRLATRLALLFAFGTPVFFRSAFINQNLVLAYAVLFAYLTLVWRRDAGSAGASFEPSRVLLAGAFLGFGLVCDYSALPLVLVFGAWLEWQTVANYGPRAAVRTGGAFTLGLAGPVAVLLAYQFSAFGSPFALAQARMPPTDLSTAGWHGLEWPSWDLLWRNLFDPGFGLLAFCPMLIAAVLAPRYRRSRGGVGASELVLIFSAFLSLYVFSSSIAYASLQWNTGVRYLVPAAPLLYLAAVPVLLNAPRWLTSILVILTVVISWAVSMARESVPRSVSQLLTHGLELPWHTVLEKTSPAYVPALAHPLVPLALFLALGVTTWVLWRGTGVWSRRTSGGR